MMSEVAVDEALLKAKAGIRLDIGCGEAKQPNFIGMDIRDVPGVDIVHDAEDFPYPMPDNCCLQVLMSHLWEHIEPKNRIKLMDEIWRIMKPDGQLLISAPYYLSFGAYQDPTHYPCPNEACLTPDTEVLTYEGFKKITGVTMKDLVLSLNPNSRLAEYITGCQLVSYEHDGEMVNFLGRAIDLLTNLNHRIWYATRKTQSNWRFAPASEFLNKNPKATLFDSEIRLEGQRIKKWVIPEVEINHSRAKKNHNFDPVDFAEFMGWYLSEGSVELTPMKHYYRVHISQTDDQNKSIICDVVERLGFRPITRKTEVVFSAYTLAHWLKQFGHCEEKYIPRELLVAQQPVREALLNSLMLGDGTKAKGSQISYTSLSKRLADDVQELMLKCGYRASISTFLTPDKNKIMYRISGHKSDPIYAKEFKKVYYKGTVHSLIMPKNHIYMARRKGKCVWTGNTFTYFDPKYPLYQIYKPKPWKLVRNEYQMNGNLEVIMEAIKDERK